jgi:hypothetical protein
MRSCSFNGITRGDAFTGLLSAMQAERCRRRERIGQNGESLPARRTDSAPHPNAFGPLIVHMTEPLSMADDRMILENRTLPWQEIQWDHAARPSLLTLAGIKVRDVTYFQKDCPWHAA